jgi:hypothetical protein
MASKLRPDASARRFARAPATLVKETPTRTCTVRRRRASKVTNAPACAVVLGLPGSDGGPPATGL